MLDTLVRTRTSSRGQGRKANEMLEKKKSKRRKKKDVENDR